MPNKNNSFFVIINGTHAKTTVSSKYSITISYLYTYSSLYENINVSIQKHRFKHYITFFCFCPILIFPSYSVKDKYRQI